MVFNTNCLLRDAVKITARRCAAAERNLIKRTVQRIYTLTLSEVFFLLLLLLAESNDSRFDLYNERAIESAGTLHRGLWPCPLSAKWRRQARQPKMTAGGIEPNCSERRRFWGEHDADDDGIITVICEYASGQGEFYSFWMQTTFER